MNKEINSEHKSSINPETGKRIINLPTMELPGKKITVEELDKDIRERIHLIRREFIEGLNFIRQHKHSVTFFGSARFNEDSPYYKKAQSLAKKLADRGIDVITGAGPGIMEAANRGAADSDNGHSLGLDIALPEGQVINPYVEDNVDFYYFFSRKVALTFSAEAFVLFPGGYGTLDEFFEILTLIQTNKIQEVPMILFGKEYWSKLDDFIQNTLRDEYEAIDPEDVDLYTICDSEEEAIGIIEEAPMRDE